MNDDKADDKPMEAVEPEVTEPSDTEQDAINALVDIEGDLTANEEPLEVGEVKEPDAKAEDETTTDKKEEPAEEKTVSGEDEPEVSEEASESVKPVEIEPEKDEAGVYEEPKTQDPGDFKPQDYSFEVKTTDGKTHKITVPEDADSLLAQLDENPELMTASQFSILNRKATLMEQGIDSDRKTYLEQKTQHEAEQALTKTREDMYVQWNNEINYLASRGELPEISEANNKAKWEDPEVAKDPAVAARLGLLKWMETENSNRIGAGLEPIKSLIDANNAMQLEKIRAGNKEEQKTETQKRRQAGAKIGGSAPYSPEGTPKNSIVGSGGSLNDLVTEFMNTQ